MKMLSYTKKIKSVFSKIGFSLKLSAFLFFVFPDDFSNFWEFSPCECFNNIYSSISEDIDVKNWSIFTTQNVDNKKKKQNISSKI